MMIRRILLLLCVLVAVTASVRTQTVEPSGIYRCEGTNANGKAYQAVVEIKKNGNTYLLRWLTPGGIAHIGVGVVEGKSLSVGFFGETVGVAVYELDGSEKLSGHWTVLQGAGEVFRETLTKWHEGEPLFRSTPPAGPVL